MIIDLVLVRWPKRGPSTAIHISRAVIPAWLGGLWHQGDRCGGLVQGIRFKCLVCPDFDLCAACLQKGRPVMGKGSHTLHAEVGQETHQDSHEMLLLPRAASNSTVASLVSAWQNGKGLGASSSLGEATACRCRAQLPSDGALQLWSGAVSPLPALLRPTGPVAAGTGAHIPGTGAAVGEAVATGNSRGGRGCLGLEDLGVIVDTFETILGHDGYISYVAVSKTSGRCAGYLILELGGDSKHRGYPCYVMSLAVLPCFRSHGVAQQLLQEALCEAQRHHSPAVDLHVHTCNEGAIKLCSEARVRYRRCGFDVLEEVRGFYGSGDRLQSGDAYVMRCLLKA
eukprot:Skav217737  [mRNA]  locus=scaffold2847:35617:40177:+ [translate_table: standard]